MARGIVRVAAVALIAAVALPGAAAAAAPPAFPPDLPRLERREGDAAMATLPPSVVATLGEDGRWQCRFRFAAPRGAERVRLAGSFNHWNPSATPMRPLGDGVFEVDAVLPPGRQLYKFVVATPDGRDRWLHDPRNTMQEPDGHGGANSLLRLGPEAHLEAAAVDAQRGDGRIEGHAVVHDPALPLYLQGIGDGRTLVRLRTLRGDVEGGACVVEGIGPIALAKAGGNELFTWWEAILPPAAAGARYLFTLQDGPMTVRTPETYSLERDGAPHVRTPDWAKDAVWYQIMLDRFRNGDPSNDPDPVRPWRSEWYSTSPWEGRDGQSFYEYFVFSRLYGGDLQGLREKLGYLKELGVNALYLTPVFQSESHHKYNATNFLHIDEHFGVKGDYAPAAAKEDPLDPSTWTFTETDRLFLEVLAEAKAMGFRVVIDGVFNHVGTRHPAFVDVRRNGPDSRYADWFEVTSWKPFQYEGWAGFGELPVFAKSPDGLASEAATRHVMEVTRRWMDPNGDGDPSDGIDGWRLDVPNEVPMPFWFEWRKLVKAINPDAYITGEIWQRADQWLDGRSFDAVMNYPFAEAALAWIGDRERKIPPSEMDRRLAELRLAYPAEVTYALMNLTNSHDTDRLVSMLANPDRAYDQENREQQGATYDASKPGPEVYRRARLVELFKMTYIGAPMVYYGDEAGMWGSDDPNNRKPMLWKDLEPYEDADENFVMEDHLAFYREAIGLRRRLAALRRGSFRTILCDDEQDVFLFLRELGDERVLVALNASEREAQIEIPPIDGAPASSWRLAFGADPDDPADDELPVVKIPPVSGRVWVSGP